MSNSELFCTAPVLIGYLVLSGVVMLVFSACLLAWSVAKAIWKGWMS